MDPGQEPPYRRPTLPWEREADRDLGWARWASAGLEFGLCVVLFFLGGRWLDGNLGTDPWLTLTGSLLGVAAGMYLLIRTAVRGELPPPKDPAAPPSTVPAAPGPAPRSGPRTGRGDGPPPTPGAP